MARGKIARFLVTIEVEVTGNHESARELLLSQASERYPPLNVASYGDGGSYDIRCLGVRSVRASGAKGGGR